MTKLIQLNEAVNEYSVIIEGEGKDKQYYLESIWMQANVVNRNGRKYQKHEFDEQINLYNEKKVPHRQAVGELDHPDGGGINMHRMSHIFETPLYMDGDNVCGKARVLNTAYGQTLKVIIDEKIPFGVSSRGYGMLKRLEDYNLVSGFKLETPGDVVWNQSAPDAIPKSIIEMIVENDKKVEKIYTDILLDDVKKVIHNTPKSELDEEMVRQFNKIMQRL